VLLPMKNQFEDLNLMFRGRRNINLVKESDGTYRAVRSEISESWTGTLKGKDVTLPGVKTEKFMYTKRAKAETEALRSTFDNSVRKEFLQELAKDSIMPEKFKEAGMNPDEVIAAMDLLRAGKVPKGYQVHHKYPLDDGGDNNFSNLVLIKNDPYHKVITAFQNSFSKSLGPNESVEVEFPIPPGKFYSPPHIEF
jgi:hypothetical protein